MMETFLQSLQHQLEEERKRREWYQRLHAALEINLEMILDDFKKKEKTCQKRIEELNAEIHLLQKTLKEESSAVLQINAARRLFLTVGNDKRTKVSRLRTLLKGRNAQQKESNRAFKMKLKDLEKRVKYTLANQALLNLEMRKHKAKLGRLEVLLEEERNAQQEKSNTSFNKKVVVDLEENLQTTFATKVRVGLEVKEYKAEVGRLKALLEDWSAQQEE